MSEHHLNGEMVREIKVASISELKNWFVDYEPKTLVDVVFSLPYSIAMVVHQVKPGLDWFRTEILADPKIKDMALRVKVELLILRTGLILTPSTGR